MQVTVFIEVDVGPNTFILVQQILIVLHKRTGEDPHKVISASMLRCIGVIH